MKLYNLTNKAWRQYQLNTAGNRDTPKPLARLKLSRNIALGKVVAETDTHVTYRYGYLNITVLREHDLIVDAHQEFMVEPHEPDNVGYDVLNEIYCIPTDV